MALTKIGTGGIKDDAASQAAIADEAIDEARLQISNAGSNGQFLQKQSGNTGGLTWAAAGGAGSIADDSITEVKLDIHSDPSGTDKFLAYTSNGMEWAVPTDTNTQLSTEQVQDIVGAMFTGNTETNITATYEDSDGTIDLVSTNTQVGGATGVDFNDDVYIRLGTGNDLKLWHNADADSYIRNESGNLLIEANGAGDDAIKIIPDGAVELYYDNSKKFETTSAGVTVTGTVTDSTGELRTIVQNTQAGAYTLVAADAGKHILASGNITVPDSVFTAGQAITIVNNTAGDLTITKGTTLYNTADGTNANRTLATRGMATLLFTAADTAYISGAGLS